MARQDAIAARRSEELRIAEEPLIGDLEKVGIRVESAWDLVNTAEAYPEAVPVLLEHLARLIRTK